MSYEPRPVPPDLSAPLCVCAKKPCECAYGRAFLDGPEWWLLEPAPCLTNAAADPEAPYRIGWSGWGGPK